MRAIASRQTRTGNNAPGPESGRPLAVTVATFDDGLRDRLNEIDERAGQGAGGRQRGGARHAGPADVKPDGERVPGNELTVSGLVIPPTDLTLEETRKLFSDDGLIPDLPTPT